MLWTKIVVVAAAGALGAGLAQRGVSIYHDGLRALIAEAQGGRLPGGQLAAMAFRMGFGLLAGFALPISLVSGLLLVHALWLGTDLIGVCLFNAPGLSDVPGWKTRLGLATALGTGALYGAGLVLGLEGFNLLTVSLPVQLGGLSGIRALLGRPAALSFAAFPAIAIAYQHGLRSGVLAFGVILIARLLTGGLGWLHPDAWALAVGLLIVFLLALRERPPASTNPEPLFNERQARLRRLLPVVVVLGALYGLAAHQFALVEGPQALLALVSGWRGPLVTMAIAIGLARALAFTPIKAMSVLTSGVFVTDGLGFAWAAGLAAPRAWSAALLGGLVMGVELLSLEALSRLLQRYPGLVKAAGHMRTAMTRLLEAALLVGGMLAAENLAPGYGFLSVAGIYLLNEAAGVRLLRMAVGPLALLPVWIAANLAAIFG